MQKVSEKYINIDTYKFKGENQYAQRINGTYRARDQKFNYIINKWIHFLSKILEACINLYIY